MSKEDMNKILKGALIATGGALLTYLAQIPEMVDFGDLQPLVVAFFSVGVNIARKYIVSIRKNK